MATEQPAHLQRGKLAEDLALAHLQRKGLKLQQRNYRTPYGEIDLVMTEPTSGSLVFVEVRYRKDNRFGGAELSIDHRKQSRLLASAEHFLQQYNRFADAPCRFDVVALSGDLGKGSLQWYQNAFE